ncbi:hypothetical protein HZA55_02610 [Candidatus Poribacteria bacterium]|nr:hypothetical protein [Candidatus Poribacteria bacterium]
MPKNKQNWYVVQTKPKNENLVTHRLQDAGFEVLNPKIEKYIYRNKNKILMQESLFPNYIFVNFILNKHYSLIKWTYGVNKIVGNGDDPISINEKIVEFIKNRITSQGLIKPINQFNIGDKIQIKTGPFKNLLGVIENPVSGKGRIKVLLELINYQCKVEMHQSEVDKC